MNEMSLVVAVGVPYEVEITATGIPMHKTEVEFCVLQNDVRYAFPAKMVNDNKFIFNITDALEHLINKTLDYKLFVHYGNARFEADSGSFNLLDKNAFDVKMKDGTDLTPKTNALADILTKKTKPKATPLVTKKPKPTPTVEKEEPKVSATKPTPTPEVTPTTTLKEAKEALNESSLNEDDYNKKVKEILSGLSKTATPTHKIQTTATPLPTTTISKDSGRFFDDVAELKKTNEERRRKKKAQKKIRDAILPPEKKK